MNRVRDTRKHPGQIKSLRAKALKLVSSARFGDALALYDELCRIEPKEGEWPRRAADCCWRLKDQDQRLRYSVMAARAYSQSGLLLKAIAMCKVALSIDPNHRESRAELARLHANKPKAHHQAPALRPAGPYPMDPIRAMRIARDKLEGDAKDETIDKTPRARARMAAAALMRKARAKKHLEEQAKPHAVEPKVAGQSIGRIALRKQRSVPEKPQVIEVPHDVEENLELPAPSLRIPVPQTGSHPPLSALSLSEHVKTEIRVSMAPGSGNVYSLALKDVPVIELRAAPLPRLAEELQEDPERAPEPAPPSSDGPSESVQEALRRQEADRKTLQRTPLFDQLDADLLEYLIEIIAVIELDSGDVLFREGDIADAMYVVVEGSVVARASPNDHCAIELATLEEGEFFGEIGLLSDQPRQATVTATQPTRLLRFDRATVGFMSDQNPGFLGILLNFLKDRLVENLMLTSPLLAPFDEREKHALLEQFEFLEIESNSVLLDHGQPPVGMYVLLAGQALLAQAPGKPGALRRLSPGDVFGEQALLYNQPSRVQVRTTSKCFALCLPSDAFSEIIMTHPTVLEYLGSLSRDESVHLAPDFLDHVSLF